MLTQEANDRYTRVGPGTPMGELMRRYWHPVAAVSQMNDKWTMKVRLLERRPHPLQGPLRHVRPHGAALRSPAYEHDLRHP